MLLIGEEAEQVYKTKRKTGDESKTIEDILTALFVTKKSENTEVVVFRRALRNAGESVNDYAMRLGVLSTHCKFGAALKKEIERQFVVGCGIEDVQRKCARTDDLDLEKILAIAAGYERVNASVSGLQTANEGPSRINYAAAEQSSKTFGSESSKQASRECGKYGGSEHQDKAECRAWGKNCNKCGKPNHFANVCRSRVDQTLSNSSGLRSGKDCQWQNNQSGSKRLNMNDDKLETSNGSYRVNEENYAQYLRYLEAVKHEMCSLHEMSTKQGVTIAIVNEGPRADILVSGSDVSFLIDTGSPINVIDHTAWDNLGFKPNMTPCKSRFFGFTSKTPIEVMGQFSVRVYHINRSAIADFIVVRGNRKKC